MFRPLAGVLLGKTSFNSLYGQIKRSRLVLAVFERRHRFAAGVHKTVRRCGRLEKGSSPAFARAW
jgi:hypothetical protein